MDDVDIEMKSLMKQRLFKEAEVFIRKYINSVEGSRTTSKQELAKAYNWLGLCRYKAVEFDEAKHHYSTAIALDPGCAQAYYNRGTVCYRMGESEAAVSDMKMAVEQAPDNGEFQQGLLSACKLQQLTQAKERN
ncbi:Tetratricopeptide-like helical domain [Trinorchestia longiramus]|nr:Tetratricopeptide-like helical domain [Trinorchestia longiramus]